MVITHFAYFRYTCHTIYQHILLKIMRMFIFAWILMCIARIHRGFTLFRQRAPYGTTCKKGSSTFKACRTIFGAIVNPVKRDNNYNWSLLKIPTDAGVVSLEQLRHKPGSTFDQTDLLSGRKLWKPLSATRGCQSASRLPLFLPTIKLSVKYSCVWGNQSK